MTISRYFLHSFIIVMIILGFPAIAPAYQERLILAMTEGTCVLRVEADDQSHTLRLRLLPEGSACQITKTSMQTILKAAFSKTDPPKLEGPYTSLFLGRLVEYPWLSAYLAMSAYHDVLWNRKKGKPVAMDLYQYVRTILSKKEITLQFEETFGDSGYRIAAVTVEKVGVSHISAIPFYTGTLLPGKVPFDAMVWLILEKKASGFGHNGHQESH
ncbi:MAG: hypothetical protein JZU50_12545 [Desulfobulbaceae bacterium]|nr:hypothetical protein [Desulfobulbaceae bacterium]